MSNPMNRPPVVELENKAGCRYMLVSVISKRARQIQSSNKSVQKKPVAQAVEELYDGNLKIKFPTEYYQNSEK